MAIQPFLHTETATSITVFARGEGVLTKSLYPEVIQQHVANKLTRVGCKVVEAVQLLDPEPNVIEVGLDFVVITVESGIPAGYADKAIAVISALVN